MGKWILRLTAAVLGVTTALYFFGNYELYKVESTAMLPILEPGGRVLIKKCEASDISVGDLVLYRTDVYEFDSQEGRKSIRMVSGKKDGCFRLSCSPDAVYGRALTVDGEKLLGKVILWEKGSEN